MKGRTTTALFWSLLDVGGSQGFAFLLYVILTRILSPAEYGVFALSVAIVAMANVVLYQGFADALIQREDADEDARSTAFWVNMALGCTLGTAIFLAAQPIAALFREPSLGPVLEAMAVLCPLRALVSVHQALCRREMRMAVFAIRAFAAYAVGGAVGVVLALQGWGVWSLVICQLVQAAIIAAVTWASVRWVPRLRFSRTAFAEIAAFGRHFMAAGLLAAAAEKIDSIVIGLVLDATAVGYYNLALKVLQAVQFVTLAPLAQIIMPVLSRLVADRAAFRAEHVRLVTAALAAYLPAIAGIGVLAPLLVPLAFGPQWVGAVPLLQAMCLACFTLPLWFLTGQALAALGRPERYARLAGIHVVLATCTYAIAAQFGVIAVGLAWAAVSALVVPLHLRELRHATGLGFGQLAWNAVRIGLCGICMVAVVLGAEHWLDVGPFVAAGIGAVAYLAMLELVLLPGYVSGTFRTARAALPAFGGTR